MMGQERLMGMKMTLRRRVIGLALASILFLRCLSWSFQVLGGQPIYRLTLGTYDATTSRAASGAAGRAAG
jgi:hypothetical protein